MSRPHAALIELAAGRPLPPISDMGGLVQSARDHRMSGLLWSRVESGENEVPERWTRALAQDNRLFVADQHHLWSVLQDIDLRLRSIGIEVATARGVTAELRWYDHCGERPCSDIDLLIAPKDFARIGEILQHLEPLNDLVDDLDELLARGWLQSADILVPPGVWVQLHTDILKLEVGSRQLELIWERTVEVPTPGGGSVRALDPEMSLIHFLLHLNKDRFSLLRDFVDVVHLIEREDLDWDFIDGFLRTEGFDIHGYLSLQVVTSELRLDLPHRPRPNGWRAAAWRRLWRPGVRLRGELGALGRHRRQTWMPFLAHGRAGDSVRAWLRVFFPPNELMRRYHPDAAGPYPWRATSRVGFVRRRLRRISDLRKAESTRRPRYKDFPPGWNHIKVPLASRRAATSAIAAYTASRPRSVLPQRFAWAAVSVFGPRVLPGGAAEWSPPMPQESWLSLLRECEQEFGPFNAMAVYQRRQPTRSGFALLLIADDVRSAFVKIEPTSVSELNREFEAQTRVLASRPRTFRVPEARALGEVGGWTYLAMDALPGRVHTPARKPPLQAILSDIETSLSWLPRPALAPSHWRPMHGDFTPWNLRRWGSSLVLLDWEHVGYGPPRADETLYLAAHAALRKWRPSAILDEEAAAFWRERVAARTGQGKDARQNLDLLRRLSRSA